jgi:lipoteichoic acid synthase
LKGNITLSESQINDIKQLVAKSRESISDNINMNDHSNIIFILVESYMSFTSDFRVGEKEVTPFLNSLKHDSTVYFNGRMKKNVTLGGSSDGQFIYMTGLLPLRSVLTVSKARSATMPGLPKLLGRKSRMVIPTVTSIWDQDQMCRQYGFDELYAIGDYSKNVMGNLTDEQVFELALQKDKESQQPFFSVILTINMHQPYVEQIDPSFPIKDDSITDELANYLNACHYTDMQIHKYIKRLKEAGLYDNSLIVIAADHPVDNTDFGGVNDDIPLYIINSGLRPDALWQRECNQVDLYTTLLDMLGCKCDWYGLGCSLASPNYMNSVNEHSYDVSEWIIFGNYFNH